ncbi:MAG: peptidoglycan-binding protein [Acidimicrobiia bacterium]
MSLQQTLIDLGYLSGDEGADGIFGAATEEAVTMLYEAIGYQPAPAPEGVADTSILEAQNAVDQARQALREAEAGGDATSITIASRNLQIAMRQHTALAEMPRLTLPASEILALPFESILVFGSGFNEGDVIGFENPLLEIRTNDVFVTATGTRGQVAQISLNQPALIVAQEYRIESIVESIAPVPDAPDQIVLHLSLPRGELQPGDVVTVEVETDTTGVEVLSVPVSAVRTDADGSSYVTVAEQDGQRRVAVELGITVGGRIVVTGSVRPGELVVVGSQ